MFNYRKFFNTRSKRAFGIIGIALSLGATGALVTQNSSQNIARNTSSNATMRNSLLKRDNQALKSTAMLCSPFAWLLMGCRIPDDPKPPQEDQRQNERIGELEKKVSDHETRIRGVEGSVSSVDKKLDKTNTLLEEIKKTLEKQNSPTRTTTTRTPSKTKTTKKTTTRTPSKTKTTKRS